MLESRGGGAGGRRRHAGPIGLAMGHGFGFELARKRNTYGHLPTGWRHGRPGSGAGGCDGRWPGCCDALRVQRLRPRRCRGRSCVRLAWINDLHDVGSALRCRTGRTYRCVDLMHVAVAEAGLEIPRVVATEGLRPTAPGSRIALGQDARTGLQVRARLECLLVGIEAVLLEVLAIDLRQAQGKVVATLLEHARGCQRLRQVPGLADKAPADHADRIAVERGFDLHDVLHDFRRHCQVLASHEFHSREHGFPLSLRRLEYYVSVMAAARRVYETPPTILERK